MAHGPVAVMPRWPGWIAVAAILSLTLGTLALVAWRAEDSFGLGSGLGPADWAAVRFTLLQATLSAVLSVAAAIPLARALARRAFPGRGLLITLLGAPFILPVIVAVLGLLAVYGRNGFVSQGLSLIGAEPISIYGLTGVVLAHVFFNMPLATRFLLQGWLAIPAERFRLAASLGFSASDTARLLEWPMLRATVPGAALVVFLICTTSFAVALALGGGPAATTVELAIYQAFRLEFDLSRAAFLSLVQVAICTLAAALAFRFAIPAGFGAGLDRTRQRWDAAHWTLRAVDTAAILAATLFLLVPLALVVARGFPALPDLSSATFAAAGRSLWVAAISTALTGITALSLALLIQSLRRGAQLVEGIGYLSIAASPLVIGTGLFIAIFPFASPVALALPVTAVVNTAMSLPFALRALVPALAEAEAAHGRLADSLGLTGWARLRLVLLPRLRRPLGFALGLAAALSMGDLGVIALFADPSEATLPLLLYSQMSAYRMDDAAASGLVLIALSLLAFWIFDRGGRANAHA
ncbi:thiamine/thiamine pyrophosphate ABC transporter permease ThiP [Anianabacter salinae]|uniref:thiamine/thiamine pyrophosphate ABC transporter permease ThiP n=1 Tax=Anianabacter salinae TaxID=2851023 RepID=UPI00225DD717|nr:thiamine/thiamine pyrophosphate ABC transporter permease ThiP [Anianabacter salinae]MBV0913614.1 thiamine/thiamine pyrophosphate ABC transporter permease ThiP [Anianabacter salinae]